MGNRRKRICELGFPSSGKRRSKVSNQQELLPLSPPPKSEPDAGCGYLPPSLRNVQQKKSVRHSMPIDYRLKKILDPFSSDFFFSWEPALNISLKTIQGIQNHHCRFPLRNTICVSYVHCLPLTHITVPDEHFPLFLTHFLFQN